VEVFTTDRLLLRGFTAADVDLLAELDGDPEVRRYLADGRPVARTVVEREILPKILTGYTEHPGFGCWAVLVGTEFAGWVELLPEAPGEASVGWRFLPRAWGHGYATEAARALLDHAVTRLRIRRVTATTMTVNTASRRVMERLGMTYVRTFFEDWPVAIEGAEHGDVEYELVLTGPGTSRSAHRAG
jgi:RimJ/RimL family protein N-acetyltransferase